MFGLRLFARHLIQHRPQQLRYFAESAPSQPSWWARNRDDLYRSAAIALLLSACVDLAIPRDNTEHLAAKQRADEAVEESLRIKNVVSGVNDRLKAVCAQHAVPANIQEQLCARPVEQEEDETSPKTSSVQQSIQPEPNDLSSTAPVKKTVW